MYSACAYRYIVYRYILTTYSYYNTIHDHGQQTKGGLKNCIIYDWACKNQPCECKLHLVIYLWIPFVLKWICTSCKPQDSPLNSTSMVLSLFNLYKQIISYNRAKLKKVGDFYALTWLIFAGLVTYNANINKYIYWVLHWHWNRQMQNSKFFKF